MIWFGIAWLMCLAGLVDMAAKAPLIADEEEV